MNTKKCRNCRRVFPVSEFGPSTRSADGLHTCCLPCAEELRKKAKEYYHTNHKARNEKNKKQLARYHSDPEFKERVNKTRNKNTLKQYHADPEFKKRANETRTKNILKQYHADPEFKKRVNKTRTKNILNQYHADPAFRLNNNISSQIRQSLHDGKEGKSWEKLVGYSLSELMQHLESLFEDGMTWENYGDWHIDHSTPVSWFNFDSVDDADFSECWSLENLQPMWGEENIEKSNKFTGRKKKNS